MNKKIKVFLAASVIGTMLAGCGGTGKNSSDSNNTTGTTSSGSTATATKTEELRPIKIGLYTYLTGDFANLGQAQKKGVEIAVKQINDAGGVNGHKLQLISYDDRATTEMDVQCVTKLVEVDKVDAIIGNCLSAAVLATKQITEPLKIIQLVGTPSEKITNLSPYVFRVFSTYDVLNKQNVKNMADLGVKKAGLIYGNTETGISSAKIFTKMIEDAGIGITSEAYNYGDTDYTSQFAKMYSNGATNIFVNMNTNEQGLAFQQIRRLGHNEIIFANEGACAPEVRKVAGAAANGVVFSSVNVIPDTIEEAFNDIEKKFLTDYKNSYGELPKSDLAYRGYDQMLTLAEAFRNTKNIDDKEEVRNNFAGIKGFEGVQGVYDYTAGNGDGLASAKSMVIWEGKIITLDKYKELTKK
jgi:ABC-type branched-chain amino acid transport systems, periplasmic component